MTHHQRPTGIGLPVVDKCPTNNNRQRARAAPKQRSNNNNNTSNRTNTRRRNPKSTNAPSIGRASDGIRIRHREYITSINSVNAGYLQWGTAPQTFPTSESNDKPLTILVNPGDGTSFPWLSSMAPNFEFYTIHSIKFIYTSSCSAFTRGAVALVPEYDPNNYKSGFPETLPELMNKIDSVKSNVWTDCHMALKRNIGMKKLVRPNHHMTHTGEHLRQTDVAALYIAVYNTDSQDDFAFGDLFVEYDVSLHVPNFGQQSAKSILMEFTSTVPGVPQGNPSPLTHSGPLPGSIHGAGSLINGPQYNGHEQSTLGVTAERLNDVGIHNDTGSGVDVTRIYFEEPFQGRLEYHADNTNHSAANCQLQDAGAVTTYSPDFRPERRALTEVIHSTNGNSFTTTNPDHTTVMDIKAAAGDVLDLTMSAAGTWLMESAYILLTDVAAGLLML